MQKRNSYLIGKAFKNYLTASVLTVAATQVASIVDGAIVGNLIGPEGLAAVNLSKPLLQAFYATSLLYIVSTTMLTGMAIGRGDKQKANKLFSFSIIASSLLSVVFVIGGLAFFGQLSELLCKSDNLRPMTEAFMRVTILSAVPQLLMLTFHQFVTVDGSPRLISRAVIVGNIFNICFDIIFIKYCGWGIAGAAWATFIMYIVCILMVLPHFRKKGTLRFCLPNKGDIEWGRLVSLGLPSCLGTVLISVQYVGNNYVASVYLGDGGLIALAVCIQLFTFSMIILTGTLRTIQPVGSILKGLGDDRGMLLLLQRAYKFMAICLAVYAVAITIFPAQISQLLGANNEASLPVILDALPLFSLNIIMQSLLYVLISVFQFYGHRQLAIFLSLGQTLLPMFGFWALKGGWIGFFLGQVVVAIVILICTTYIRSKDKSVYPLLLIPKTEPKDVFDVTIETNINALAECRTNIGSFLLDHGIDADKVNRLVLCVEELAKNIIQHGHAKYIDVRATDSVISLHDDGKPFNPLEYEDGDEGYGLKLVHGFMPDLKYDYRFNQNMVRMDINL